MKISSETSSSSSFIGVDEQWPPGFRFHPTDEELILYYLKRKICRLRLKFDAIADVDVYKADPEDFPRLSKLKTGDRQWFFFSSRDRKYINGGRSNRATRLGYWKATGKDRPITCNSRSVGIKKTLVFYRGRAPSGERTDWVMHEYTLDEEELKRCPAQDCYALYKIYKKSGPGPKNGEQYGAPFREEDWADDEKATDCVNELPISVQFSQHLPLENIGTNNQSQSQINGLDMLFNRVVNDPLFEPISEPYGTKNTTLEKNVQEKGVVFPSCGQCGQLNGDQPCFDLTQSKSSQFHETSEVTCATNMIRQGSHDSSEKDIVEDFLEIDDLFGPEPTQQITENPVEDLRIEDFDGLCELDLFEDVSLFLQDAGDTEPTFCTYNNNDMNQICNPAHLSCCSNLDSGLGDRVSVSYLNDCQTEMVQPVSQPSFNYLGGEMENQFNYEMPHDPDVAGQIWMHKPHFSIPTSASLNHESVNPPGMIYGGVNQNQSQNHNQLPNESGKVSEGEESWLSSSLWSFLENIPTTPASASESKVLVNKAFEQLSSFGRSDDSIKASLSNTSANAGDLTASGRRYQNKYSKGFMLFSFIGVLSAIFWVFTGTCMRVLER